MFYSVFSEITITVGNHVLEREICSLRDQGFSNLILTVSYMGDKIINYFGNCSKLGLSIQYYNKVTPLGNAWALFKLRDQITEDFLFLNAVAIFDVNFARMIDWSHRLHILIVTHTTAVYRLLNGVMRCNSGWQKRISDQNIIRIMSMQDFM